MTEAPPSFGLLLAAHGERRAGAGNDAVMRLAARVAARGIAREVACGFVRGEPSLEQALRTLTSDDIVVWPLFLCDGHFARTQLPRRLACAANGGARTIRFHTPLGLDRALPGLITTRLRNGAPAGATIVLLAHGSAQDPASRMATEKLASGVAALGPFNDVRAAFLDEAPALADTVAGARGPVVIIGLFVGEGLHGRGDVPRLIAALNRPDLTFAGNVGGWPELVELAALIAPAHAAA